VRTHLIGHQGNGGNYLKMFTTRSTKDYSYNREFQRMRYLTEVPVSDYSAVNPQLLADIGVPVPPTNSNPVLKSAPHPKYY